MGVRRNSMFYGALLLSLSSIVLKCVQMVFQVYISGVMGPAGLGRMQLILTVGSFAAIVASGGVRIAATCLAAEEAGRGNQGGVRAAIRCCALYGFILSLLTSCLLWALAPLLSRLWLQDLTAMIPLRILAVFLPVGCLWAVLAGYYTASGRITELVALELGERVFSVLLVVLLLETVLVDSDPCTAVFLGSSLASCVSLLVLSIRYAGFMAGVPSGDTGVMFRRLLQLTLPIGFNDVLRKGLGALENLLIPRGLRMSGSSQDQALSGYGTICGMVFPVITFPSVILSALSDLLVPEMARSRALNRQERIRTLTDRCLRMTLYFAAAAAGSCFLLGDDLGLLLFRSSQAGLYIRVFSPLILMLYLDNITDGILKGLSQQLHTARYNTLTSLLDLGLLVLLLPRQGIGGFLMAFTLSHGVNFFLSLRRLMLVTGYYPTFRATLQTTVCCGLSLLVITLWPDSGNIPWVLLRGVSFLSLFLLMLRLTDTLTREDLRWIRRLAQNRGGSTQ